MQRIKSLLNHFKWVTAGLFLLVFGIMGWIVIREWDTLITFPWHVSFVDLGLALFFHSLALGVTFWVWHLMIARLGNFDDLKTNFRFYYLSAVAKRIPTAIWYIGGRLIMYQAVGVASSAVINSIILESVVIGMAGVFAFLGFWPFYTQIPNTGIGVLIGLGLAGTLGLLMRPQLFVDITNFFLSKMGQQILSCVPTRRDILLWWGLYLLPWIFAGLSFYYAIFAFLGDAELHIVDAMGVSTLMMLVALLSVVLPGGLGLKELTATALLTPWMPFSYALVISIAYRLLQTMNELVWALFASRFQPIEVPAGFPLAGAVNGTDQKTAFPE